MQGDKPSTKSPNIVFIFADQWRAQATGYNGDPNCETPVLDQLVGESINVTHAVSGCPVCTPYRASLMTGQYPLTNGVYINDVELDKDCLSIAQVFGSAGYDSCYIGKWHIYGSPDGKYGRRKAYVPREHQLGFDYWKGFECTHDYNDSFYYYGEDSTRRRWDGYDAFAQCKDAAAYIREHRSADRPFIQIISLGPPHFPLHTAPEEYRNRYRDRSIELRPNVPEGMREAAQEDLRGYYAHIAALDDCLALVLEAIRESGLENDTILAFTSDHGDMGGSQGLKTQIKLVPWDESIRVPLLIRWPALHGGEGKEIALPIDAPDLMPTLLGLCGLQIPDTVEGHDFSPYLRGDVSPDGSEAALLSVPAEFATMRTTGMSAYRGIRTVRYTYARNTTGPWLLYDNESDLYQMNNLVNRSGFADLQAQLDSTLAGRLSEMDDAFRDGSYYLERDGFDHYGEANEKLTDPWKEPWGR